MPEKITPEQYRQSRANGWSDEDLTSQGYELPSLQDKLNDSRQSPGQRLAAKGVPDVPGLAKRALGAVGKAAVLSAGSVPIAGPLGLKAAGLEDDAKQYRAEFKRGTRGVPQKIMKGAERMAGSVPFAGPAALAMRALGFDDSEMGISTAPLEIAQGIASGNMAMQALGKLNAGSKAVKAAKIAVSGSQNDKAGIANAAKRLAVNVGSGAATGAATAEDGKGVEGAMFGAAAGLLPSAIEGVGSLAKHAVTKARTSGLPLISKIPGLRNPNASKYRANQQMREMLETEKVIPVGASGSGISKPLMSRGQAAPEGSRFVDVAGDNPQRLVAHAQQTPSVEGTDLRNSMRARAEGAPRREAGAFDAATGVPRSFHTSKAIKEVEEGAKPDVKAAFDAAYSAPSGRAIDNPTLDRLLASKRLSKYVTRARRTLGETGESAGTELREPRILPFEVGGVEGMVRDGTTMREVPNLRLLHETNRELNDAWRRVAMGAKPDRSKARKIARARDLLLKHADEIPGFAEARLTEEMPRRVQDAMRLGLKAAKGGMDTRDVFATLDDLLPEGRKQAILQRELLTPKEIAEWEGSIREAFRKSLTDGMRQHTKRTGSSLVSAVGKGGRKTELLDATMRDPAPMTAAAKREEMWQRGEIASDVPVSVTSTQPDSYGGASPWSIAGIPQGRGTLAAAQEIGAMLRAQGKEMGKDVSRNISRMAGVETGSPEYKRMVAALRQSRMLERVPSNARARELGRKATLALRGARLGQTGEQE